MEVLYYGIYSSILGIHKEVSYCLQNTTLLIWTLLFKPKLDKYVETLLFQMADGHLPEVNG